MSEQFQRQIYLLSPRQLSPETIAVTFAKTSRSPLTFREIADELTDEKSAEFHEKWVVGYGHASVAEHAVLHIALENISRLATECIESNRLASYTEKSTRYQMWAPGGYHLPREVVGGSREPIYRKCCDRLFQAYHDSLEPVGRLIRKRLPRKEGESDSAWENRTRSKYVDACRFLLPAAALANVGMTINARALEHAIRKMLSHPLAEVREIGQTIKEVAQTEVPTLVKYADQVPYLTATREDLTAYAAKLGLDRSNGSLRLIDYDPEAESRVMAAALYAHGTCSFEQALAHVRLLEEGARLDLAKTILERLDRFDIPVRELEHATYTFEALIDQGAYLELKRHRMMTQTPQRLTAKEGYAVPKLITEAGFETSYREAMNAAVEAYHELAGWNPHVAAYLVPNAFNRRVLMTLNLREVYHLCELRSQPNAHFSMRRLALLMAELVQQVHPMLAAFMRLPEMTNWREIEEEHFTQV
ncbi:MAG TPA: FAD-dependent thymidylate synthase [Anaerolineae bacterium]|nr:FAD-dependent thymidylate synthase [Anaerolineae bacterium]